ncbi:MAG TPA: protein-L-isoaspartate(D-aspartate) O-methyltransferase, partial [Candidatus Binatia bacterium]|nr:protein-L-isoaspartate(D-aspartate) O-methyltransferase [Candidatus Binatia bacterium]
MTKETLMMRWVAEHLVKDPRVLQAFHDVPREHFVLPRWQRYAYEDSPLPTARGQTISQPTTIMMMLDALDVHPGMKVLEIGTGSGYNAALLDHLAGEHGKVFSLELDVGLAKDAIQRLQEVAPRVQVIAKDGTAGLPEDEPFDRIIVTAAVEHIPDALLDQLKDPGMLVAPVGGIMGQAGLKIKKEHGKLTQESFGQFL